MNTGVVFLDRDGTINEEVGYISDLGQLSLLPNACEAISLLNERDIPVVVVTNQAGVARGLFTEAFVETVHEGLRGLLRAGGARIDRFYYCPHHPTEGIGAYRQACTCRKPEPGLLLQAAAEMGIDLGRSYMVGDHVKDVEAAHRAGAKGILVRTGHGASLQEGKLDADFLAVDILAAVRWILRDRNP